MLSFRRQEKNKDGMITIVKKFTSVFVAMKNGGSELTFAAGAGKMNSVSEMIL